MKPVLVVDPLQDPWGFLRAELGSGIPLCFGIGAFLSLIFGGGFWMNIVYSLCIGLTIQFSIELGRYALVRWQRWAHPLEVDCDSQWPGWGLMAPWVAVCAVGGFWIGGTMGDALTGEHFSAQKLMGGRTELLVALVVTLVVSGLATYFFYARAKLAFAEAQAEANRRAALESQLQLLQSQLEPHMLFNTLANLRVLIGIDAARAQDMLDHLIAFLRATLNASRSSTHTLQSEFDRVADYLSLIQVRMGQRLTVELDLPEALRALQVPPLLLQPLVENAVLHGLEPNVAGGRLRVQAFQDGDALHLVVHDDGVGLSAQGAAKSDKSQSDKSPGGTGFGLHQVRERLATQFGSAARLELTPAEPHGCRAHIVLPVPALWV